MLLLGDIVIEVTGPLPVSPAKVLVVTDVAIGDECGCGAQCSYREGHAYIVKNPIVCLIGPTTKFLWF